MQKSKIDIIPPKEFWIGNVEAPLSLVMFGDYESEACAQAHEVVKKLLVKYEGRIKFNYRHFPLTQIHQKAHKAAEAAIAVAQQGKFWEMHDLIFHNRRNLGSISLRDYAIEAGMKDKNFLPKMTDSVFGWTVRNDLLEGLAMGVRDVPALFINSERFEGMPTFENLSQAIDDRLKKYPRKQRA
jgi:protein-disulfide isomerase